MSKAVLHIRCLKAPGALAVFALAIAAFAPDASAQQNIGVTSEAVEYSGDGSRAIFSGQVVVTLGAMHIAADQLAVDVAAEGNRYRATGAPLTVICRDCGDEMLQVTGDQLVFDSRSDVLEMQGGVRACVAKNCKRGLIRAQKARWNRGNDNVVLSGAPITGYWRYRGEEIKMRAARATYDRQTGEVALSGEVQVSRGDSDIQGDDLYFNVNTGEMSASAAGRVQATFGVGDE